MAGTIIASIAIAAKASHCRFLYPEEVLAEMDGRRTFPVPAYSYTAQTGHRKTRDDAVLRPDGLFALRYDNGIKRIFSSKPTAARNPIGVITSSERAISTSSSLTMLFFPRRYPPNVLWRC
jgi:hypothetical protein